MNCIIVDDEPLAREAMKLLIEESSNLQLIGSFNSASTASDFMEQHVTDLVFLDIQMPGITGIEFARTISKKTLVIFTTAYTEYALDSYEVDAIDYLIKPVEAERFQKAVDKALSYHSLLLKEEKEAIETVVTADYFFVKAERPDRISRILHRWMIRHFPGEMTEDARPVDVSRIPENMGNRKAPELSWQFRGLFCLKD